ncbi:hydratase [Clostridia bacterium]|nr:hydratase [Clostridia bacterium]
MWEDIYFVKQAASCESFAKQLLGKTYDVDYPRIVGVRLSGAPRNNVGAMDVALALIKAVFDSGYVKNSVMEFIGEGIASLSADFRIGIDVMTTETACLSSIWTTDETIREFYKTHGREEDFAELCEPENAYYDGFIEVDLSKITPMIALPFHPSNVYTIDELNANLSDVLNTVEKTAKEQLSSGINFQLSDKITDKGLRVDQCVIAGCAGGTFENINAAYDILKLANVPVELDVYPASMPISNALMASGAAGGLTSFGATFRTAFCGPCFGAGNVPANGALSIRHATRNFPNREGSKPSDGQISSVALMDAKSIAATASNGGILTPAPDIEYPKHNYTYNSDIYRRKVYNGIGKPQPEENLVFGPNIADWPAMPALPQNLLLRVSAFITDPVTTTDELIPSGETSSYRSNPLRLAEFTLSRKDPEYVGRAKAVWADFEVFKKDGTLPAGVQLDISPENTGIGAVLYAMKPGDGSAREQAASCQKVLGTWANIAREYATKRYRSNLINWGMIPFLLKDTPEFGLNDYIFIPNVLDAVQNGEGEVSATLLNTNSKITMQIAEMTEDERKIILAGCLINYYR